MKNLFLLAYKYRTFLLFIGLEILSFIFIISFNPFHNSSFFYSSNNLSGSISSSVSSVSNYFDLTNQNARLNQLNAQLLSQLDKQQKIKEEYDQLQGVYTSLSKNVKIDTLSDSTTTPIYHYVHDTASLQQYLFTPSKVIRNDIRYDENYITLNKGTKDGIDKGMGVIGPNGVVGMVVNVSENYSIAKSALHINHRIACQMKKNNVQGSLKWDAKSIMYADLQYVPKHVPVEIGDTIITSGYNHTFPEQTILGVITETQLEKHKTYHQIRVKLATNFDALNYVYIVALKNKKEILELQSQIR